MNCQEVMEYMQRELDGDLDERESAKAHEHIRQCADCTAMYERLKRLSAELENLPKVTPPFSLVDAILPKLDEIDRANAAAASANDAGAPELAGPAASVPATAPRRRNSRFSLRVLGGVVAAGVVAGIFLVTFDRDRTNDGYSGDNAVMDASSSASSGAAMFMMDSAATESAGVSDQSGPLMQKSADIGEAQDRELAAPAAEPSVTITQQPSTIDQYGDGLTDDGGDGGNGGVYPGSGSGSGAEEDRMSPPDLLQGGSIGAAEKGGAPGGLLEEAPQWGIAGFLEEPADDPVESVSPDGSFIAVFEDSRVIIRDGEGNTRFESEDRQGAISAMGWSEDGAFFRYEVRLGDGTAEIYRIDPAAGTETKE